MNGRKAADHDLPDKGVNITMSNRERIIALLDNVPEYKMGYILAYVQGITADEEADDAFCERMWENYLNDPDPQKDEGKSLEESKKEWGLE